VELLRRDGKEVGWAEHKIEAGLKEDYPFEYETIFKELRPEETKETRTKEQEEQIKKLLKTDRR